MKYLICGVLAAAAAAALTSSPAAAQPLQSQPQQACLQKNLVNGWKVVNDQTLIVTDRSRRQFTVTLRPGCHDLQWPMRLGWSSDSGFALGCIQHNDFLIVPANGPDFTQRCMIQDVQPYSAPAQHADAIAPNHQR